MKKPIVGITMGDPAGNGPEITVKALAHADIYDRCRPIVVGDAKMLEQAKGFVGRPDIQIHRCEKVSDALFTPGTIDVLHMELIPDVSRFELGKVSVEGGNAAFQCVKKGDRAGHGRRGGRHLHQRLEQGGHEQGPGSGRRRPLGRLHPL